MNVGSWIAVVVVALVVGLVVGFVLARYFLKKQLQKNPPITEKMVRTMFAQMGRKPSEKQVREIMRNMNQGTK